MSGQRPQLGELLPAGGPVAPRFVVGREREVESIKGRLLEGVHVCLIGPRRIGKTTVCDKVCAELESSHTVLRIEVPERKNGDSSDLLRFVIDAVDARWNKDEKRRGLRTAGPALKTIFKSVTGVELNLDELGANPQLVAREILELPRALAAHIKRPVLLFLDELQRVVDYADGEQLLKDLIDLYAGTSHVMVLVDGSDERALDGMLGEPTQLAKLCERTNLSPVIPQAIWKDALAERLRLADLDVDDEALKMLLTYGRERPYPTMAATQAAALSARDLGNSTVDTFDAQMGIDAATKRMRDEGIDA